MSVIHFEVAPTMDRLLYILYEERELEKRNEEIRRRFVEFFGA